ncbi:MAG: ABC transporter permease [Firmicutes bacterium]|nr:ABC transporter permease [Bacillota bacterium]
MSINRKRKENQETARTSVTAAPRPLTFWEQYRRKPQGMLGLAIVLVYVLVAIFAPLIAPYDPLSDLYLADSVAAPAWLGKVSSKYRDLPPTMRLDIGYGEWEIDQAEETVVSAWPQAANEGVEIVIPAKETAAKEEQTTQSSTTAWTSSFQWDPFGLSSGAKKADEKTAPAADSQKDAEASAVLQHAFEYNYKTPQTFSSSFEYSIDAPGDATTALSLDMVTPSGDVYHLWEDKVRGSVNLKRALVDTRDFDLKQRLGISFFDDPTALVFAERGDYTLRLTADAESASGPVTIRMRPVKFGILGKVHGLLGTDHLGSDIWSQLVYGTRIALAIGLSAAFIAVVIGTTVGLIAGYFGGIVDEVLMRIVDIMLAIPSMPVLIILGALFGKSIVNVVALLALFSWMGIARIVRAQTLSLKERTFVEAAKASGAASGYIILSHILPNTVPLIFANLVLRIPSAILTEASLSFLGLGDPRVPTWGKILQNARQFGGFTKLAWWWLIPPGLALTFLSLAFVFIGNAVNEILNPRYRERS